MSALLEQHLKVTWSYGFLEVTWFHPVRITSSPHDQWCWHICQFCFRWCKHALKWRSFNGHFPGQPGSAVSILVFTGAKNDGGIGDNWSYKTCNAPVISSPLTNHHPTFYRPDALLIVQPKMSKHWRECKHALKGRKKLAAVYVWQKFLAGLGAFLGDK